MQLTMKSSFALVAASLLSSVNAHSWVEDMNVIAPNGTFVGAPGFPRANAKRGPGVNADKAMVHLLPPNGRPAGNKILDSDPMCMESQQQPKQSDGSPMLNAAAGDMVALRYQENGHVTLPETQQGKAPNRGTVYIYGTTDPKTDEKFLSIHKVWNAEGTGGDKRGKLLTTQPYDDGQCYQVNGGQISAKRQGEFEHEADPLMGKDVWCQNNFKIPQDAPSGKPYTVYWVWDWDTAPGTAGLPQGLAEKYTTCMDISISQDQSKSQSKAANTGAVKFADGQDINRAAIQSYVQKLNAGENIFEPGTGSASGSGAAGESSASSPASSQPAAPASSQPAAAAAPASSVAQSSGPPAAAQQTVTVTAQAPASEKTVTVTANAQPAVTPATTMITTRSIVYKTRESSIAASAPVPSAQAMTVSGVVIPTTSMDNRFTGTASAVPTSAANSGSLGPEKRCASCETAKRSTILSGNAHAAAHIKGRSLSNTKIRNPGSAKFRAI